MIESKYPDLTVSDLLLSDYGGLELIREVRQADVSREPRESRHGRAWRARSAASSIARGEGTAPRPQRAASRDLDHRRSRNVFGWQTLRR